MRMLRSILSTAVCLSLILFAGCGSDSSPTSDSGGDDNGNGTGPTIPVGIVFAAIPGGTFNMGGEHTSDLSNTKPVHEVTVTAFEMSIHEVTNAQYAEYLNDAAASGDIEVRDDGEVYGKTGEWTDQLYLKYSYNWVGENSCWIDYADGSFTVAKGRENWPVIAVSWYGAKAFARFYELDLPSEAEWERACRGGNSHMFGTDDGTISAGKANYSESELEQPTDVGSYPANPYGLYDMCGNVWEWCRDWYADDYYASSPSNDPRGAETGEGRVKRGGCWFNYDTACRSAFRYMDEPTVTNGYQGFRVVKRMKKA